MFDIGFWELLLIAIVLLLVMGPERLPEVARQAAFLLRKARQGMYRLRNEMRSEMDSTPFADLEKARQEMTELKNDFRQFGNELADSYKERSVVDAITEGQHKTERDAANTLSLTESKATNKVVGKKTGRTVSKKAVKKTKVAKKPSNKQT